MYSMFISSDMSMDNRRKKIAEFVNLPEFNLTRNIYAIRIDHFEMNAASRYMWECLVETASDGGAGQQEGRAQPDPTD